MDLNRLETILADHDPLALGCSDHLHTLWGSARPFLAGELSSSLLTPSGCPLEFAFRTGSEGIAYTADLTSPDNIDDNLVGQLLPRFDFAELPDLQPYLSASDLRFGNWLSLRYKNGHYGGKVYREITPATQETALDQLKSRLPEGIIPTLNPILVGCYPGENTIGEYYCSIPAADQASLRALCVLGNVSCQLPDVLDIFTELACQSVNNRLGEFRIGVSFRLVEGQLPQLTFFSHAVELIGIDNTLVNRRLLRVGGQLGGSFQLYKWLSDGLINQSVPAYGLISIKINQKEKPELGFGWSPC
jgi:hypothetical protein